MLLDTPAQPSDLLCSELFGIAAKPEPMQREGPWPRGHIAGRIPLQATQEPQGTCDGTCYLERWPG